MELKHISFAPPQNDIILERTWLIIQSHITGIGDYVS